MKNKDIKQLLFENMEKLNPDFNLREITPQPIQPVAGQQPVAQPAAPKQPSDVQTLSRANQNATTVQTASKRINTATEFPEAFRLWFTQLGYKPNNPAISIMKVRTEIEKVMRSMGYK